VGPPSRIAQPGLHFIERVAGDDHVPLAHPAGFSAIVDRSARRTADQRRRMIGTMDPAMTLVVLALDRQRPLVLAGDVQIVTATPTRLKSQGHGAKRRLVLRAEIGCLTPTRDRRLRDARS
jgi:hypothetical protein